ncbi:gliding motility-associated C-terminal domain-containing protein [Myroides sp. LJL119]
MKIKVIQTSLLLLLGNVLYSQEPLEIVNFGEMTVSPNTLVSVLGNFENTQTGHVVSDGTMIYFDDFTNDGYYGTNSNNTSSTTIFTIKDQSLTPKQIKGNQIASFHNVTFDSSVKNVAFDLRNNIDAQGMVDFQNGIVQVDSTINPLTKVSYGMFTFKKGAKAFNTSDNSHIQGAIEKIGNEDFVYPSGHKQHYRSVGISGSQNPSDVFVGQYVYQDTAFFKTRVNSVGVINKINDQEYWIIDKGNNKQSDVLLHLTWDESTTSKDVLANGQEDLHIVRWDAKQQIWVDEGGVVDIANKQVSTIGTVKGYGIFTLATVKKDWMQDGNVVIYNLVTPNGDGKNDYFIIDNINNYPNKVEIFNRWGTRVFETTNYDPNGDGSTNVFQGYSQGKVTLNKNTKLPSGTYYYVITYQYQDDNGTRMIKKAANLHLETN